jgi:hypothetical protein
MRRKVKRRVKKRFYNNEHYMIVDKKNGLVSNGGVIPKYREWGNIFTRVGDAKRSFMHMSDKEGKAIIKVDLKIKRIKEIKPL